MAVAIGIAPGEISIGIVGEDSGVDVGGVSINFVSVVIVRSADFGPGKFWNIDI